MERDRALTFRASFSALSLKGVLIELRCAEIQPDASNLCAEIMTYSKITRGLIAGGSSIYLHEMLQLRDKAARPDRNTGVKYRFDRHDSSPQ